MNTEQIKAKVRNILSSSIGMIARDTALKLLDALEAAERERDEFKALAEEQSQLAGRNAARVQKAEEEIARRDAAAGEPVGYLFTSSEGNVVYSPCPWAVEGLTLQGPVYAAAQTAVLPPKYADELKDRAELIEAYSKTQCEIAQELGCDSDNESILKAIYELKELRAQPQKPVTIPGRYDIAEMSGNNWQSYRCIEPDGDGEYIRLDEMLSALDAANVKWVVKK